MLYRATCFTLWSMHYHEELVQSAEAWIGCLFGLSRFADVCVMLTGRNFHVAKDECMMNIESVVQEWMVDWAF